MGVYDWYCEDCDIKSKADEIIDEAKDKLVDIIWEQVKDELEVTQKENELLEKTKANLQKDNIELRNTVRKLETDYKNLKAEMERQDNIIPRTPFAIGDKVYYIGYSDFSNVKCPICKGERHITIQSEQFGEISTTCPNCKGVGCAEYKMYTAVAAWVVGIAITTKLGEKKPQMCYYLDINTEKPKKFDKFLGLTSGVFKTYDEAKAAVAEKNQKAKEEAEIKMGIKKTETENK